MLTKIIKSKYFPVFTVILTICGGVMFLIWKIMLGKIIFPISLIGHYHYIYSTIIYDFIHKFHILPNWWPSYSSGYPSALTLNGFLNPFILLALIYISPFLANNLLIFFFWTISGLSLYALARELKLSKIGSLISSISFIFSGFIIEWISVTTFSAILPFLPLSFLCCIKIISGKNKWLIPWLLLLIYSWFGGFTELVIYSLIAVSFFALYLIVIKRREENFRWKQPILFFSAIALSVLIVSPWLLSVMHFVSFSVRSEGVSFNVTKNALPTTISSLIFMLHPRIDVFYGELLPFISLGFEQYYLFIGMFPLLLVFISLFARQKKDKKYFLFFIYLATAILLLTIKNSPFFWVFHSLPVLNKFRGLWKLPFVLVFSLSIMAGYGFDNIKDFFKNKFSKYVIKILWVLLLMAITSIGIFTIFEKKIKYEIVSYGINHYKETPDRVFSRSSEYYQNIIKKMAESIVDNFSFKNKWTLLVIILWMLTISHLTIGKYELISSQKWRILTIIIVWLGSVLVWQEFFNGPPVSRLTTQKPQIAEFLQNREKYTSDQLPLTFEKEKIMEPYRIFLYTPNQYAAIVAEKNKVELGSTEAGKDLSYEMMDYNINLAFKFDTFLSHEPLALTRLINTYDQITYGRPCSETNIENKDEYLNFFFTKNNFKTLGALNIKYILSPLLPPDQDNEFKPLFTALTKNKIPIYAYENPYILPRWYFADKIIWTESNNKKSFEDFKRIEDFKKTTLLEKINSEDSKIFTKLSQKDKIELQLYTAGKLIVKTKTQDYRFIIFSENKFPDFWRAFINGKETQIYTANYLYQAALVPPGENTIEFKFSSLKDQGIISAKLKFNQLINKFSF